MNLGMNVSDRDAGSIFDSVPKMLKTVPDAQRQQNKFQIKTNRHDD